MPDPESYSVFPPESVYFEDTLAVTVLLQSAGLPVCGVSEDGRIDTTELLTPGQLDTCLEVWNGNLGQVPEKTAVFWAG